MTDRKHIESILKINGLTPTSADEEIKSVLLSARFKDDEIDAALMILRENTHTSEVRVDGLHKVFRTDAGLKPSEISQLLGIDIKVTEKVSPRSNRKRFSFFQLLLLSIASSLLAIVCLLFYMYSENIGWFHPSAHPVVNLTRST
jgi:hypothetical protein